MVLIEPLGEHVLRRLYRARACVFEMFRVRGYQVVASPYPEAEFAARLHAQRKEDVFDALTIQARSRKRKSVKAFFVSDDKVGIGVVRDITANCVETDTQHVVLVYANAITPFAKARLDELSADETVPVGVCEIFTFDQLQFNPLLHVDVPPHEPMAKQEIQDMLERSRVSLSALPKMLSSDAVARYFGATRGQVFRIRRPNPEGIVSTVYRVVT